MDDSPAQQVSDSSPATVDLDPVLSDSGDDEPEVQESRTQRSVTAKRGKRTAAVQLRDDAPRSISTSDVAYDFNSADRVEAKSTLVTPRARPTAAVTSSKTVTTQPVPKLPDPAAMVSGAVATVRSALAALFGGAGTPVSPAVAPAVWTLAAVARRELTDAVNLGSLSTTQTLTAQPVTATAANLPPVVGEPVLSEPDPTTGTVSGQLVAVDPEGKKLSYALVTGPAEGKLVFDKKTGAFSYTPTVAQRVLAGTPTGKGLATFTVTVSDGVKANIRTEVVELPIAPTPVAEINKITTGAGAAWVAATNTRAWVTNYDAMTVSVIDTISGVKIADIALDAAPAWITATPDGKKVYVVNDTTNVITVLDGGNNTKLAPIDFGANRFSYALAVSPDSKTLYVSGGLWNDKLGDWTNVVTKVSTATGKITGTVKLPGYPTWVNDITVSADGKTIYVIGETGYDDGATETTLYTFGSGSKTGKAITGVGTIPIAVTVSSDSKRAYVADAVTGLISILDTKTNKVIGTIAHDGWPSDLEVNRDGTLLAVFDYESAAVKVYDTRTTELLDVVLTTAQTGDFSAVSASSPDGMQFYFTSDDALHVLSLVPANVMPTVGTPTPGVPSSGNGVVSGFVGVTDDDDDPLSYTVTGPPAKGKVTVNPNGTFTYTPIAAARHAAATGDPAALSDSFTVTVSDGRRGIVTQTITVDVLGANIDPIGKFKAGNPSSSTGVVKGSVTGSDKDKDLLSYTVTTDPAKGSVTIDAKGRFVFTPTAAARHEASAVGATAADKTDTFTVTLDDGHGGTYDVPVTVKISPKNAKPTNPVAVDLITTSDTGRITAKLDATDLDGDLVTISKAVATKKATVRINVDGSFTYTPTAAARQAASAPGAKNSAKTDTVTFTVNDGHGGTVTLKLKVDIAPASPGNRVPVPGKYTTTTDFVSGLVTGQVTAVDSDGGSPIYRLDETVSPLIGSVYLNSSTGAFDFTPTDQARYQSALGTGPRSAIFTITPFDGMDGTPVDVTVSIVPLHPADDGSLDEVDLDLLAQYGVIQIGENSNGQISSIIGTFTDTKVRDAFGALNVLSQIAEVLGLQGDVSNGVDVQSLSFPAASGGVSETFYRMTQTVDGIPVLGGDIILATLADGTVTGISSGTDPALYAVDRVPAAMVDQPHEAVAVAREALVAKLAGEMSSERLAAVLASLTADASLVIYALDPDITPVLAWSVELDNADSDAVLGDEALPVINTRFFVAANGSNAGEVFAAGGEVAFATVNATGTYAGLPHGAVPKRYSITFQKDGNNYQLINRYPGGQLAPDGKAIVIYDNSNRIASLGSTGTWDPSVVSAMANMEKAYVYYRNALGWDFFANIPNSNGIQVRVVDGRIAGGAAWFPEVLNFKFGENSEAALDVVAHEFTHAAIEAITRNPHSVGFSGKQGDALDEAYGDILGNLIEAIDGKRDAGNWLFAEDSDGDPWRDMKTPAKYNPATFDSLTAHGAARIVDHAAYLMMTNRDTAGVSRETWTRVFFKSILRLPVNATFLDARQQILAAASVEGFNSKQLAAISSAFDQVNIKPVETAKIVLHWGATPSDLDSHLNGPATSGGRFEVFYGSRTYTSNGKIYADLDYDDTTSYGPESTTIRNFTPGDYYFYVYNYSGGASTALANSGATVTVTLGSGQRFVYKVDPLKLGRYWTVFKLTVAPNLSITVTPINAYGDSAVLA